MMAETPVSLFGTQPSNADLEVFTDVSTAMISGNHSIVPNGCLQLSPADLLPCDNNHSLVPTWARRLVQEVVYVGFLPLVTVVGVLTNVINIAVFFKQGLKDRVTVSLFSLSIADILVVLSLAVRFLDKTLEYVINESWANNVWMMSLIRYRLVTAHAGFQLVSNFICIVISVDRCLCVTRPLHAAHVFSTKTTVVVIVVFSIFAFTGIHFVAFKYDVKCAVIEGMKEPPFLYVIPSAVYRENPVLMETLDSLVFSYLVPTISILITAVATAITAIKLRWTVAWRSNATGAGGSSSVINQKEKALTKMLIGISCVYMVCVSPRALRSMFRFMLPEFRAWGSQCNLVLLTEALMNIMMAINSSFNFFVYLFMGSRYRATLRHMLAWRKADAIQGKEAHR